jgi:hypothetical protein
LTPSATPNSSGLVIAVRAWRRWVTVRDYRQAAEEAGKLADRFEDIRRLTLFRWKVTGSAALAALFALVDGLRASRPNGAGRQASQCGTSSSGVRVGGPA